jgi:hypothetical protein
MKLYSKSWFHGFADPGTSADLGAWHITKATYETGGVKG